MTKEQLKDKLNQIYDLLEESVRNAGEIECSTYTEMELMNSVSYLHCAITSLTCEIRDE